MASPQGSLQDSPSPTKWYNVAIMAFMNSVPYVQAHHELDIKGVSRFCRTYIDDLGIDMNRKNILSVRDRVTIRLVTVESRQGGGHTRLIAYPRFLIVDL